MARKMKDSGIEWIGEIPEGWEVATIGHLFSITAGGDAKPHLYSYVQDTKHPYPVYTNSSNPNQIYAYTSVPKFNENTITVTGRGDIGHAFYRNTKFDAIIRLLVLAPKSALDCRYYAYWIDNVSIFFTNSAAVGQLSAQQIFPYKTCYLPLCEQHSIANHLDFYCSKIEHILADIQNSIQEYKKLKQAVITQAVTKGVRGEREMKDSGVEWIGKIPKYWNIGKLKYYWISVESGVSVNAADRPIDNPAQYGVLKTSSVSKFIFNPHEHKQVNNDEYSRVTCPVTADCIIVSRMNTPDLVGACGYVEKTYPNLFLPDRLWQISFKNDVSAKFIWYYLNNKMVRSYISSLSTGTSSTMQNISQGQFGNISVCLPDSNEQKEIADYLDAKCAEIDKLIAKKEQLVKELESYKKSLIYEVVTGKREV